MRKITLKDILKLYDVDIAVYVECRGLEMMEDLLIYRTGDDMEREVMRPYLDYTVKAIDPVEDSLVILLDSHI